MPRTRNTKHKRINNKKKYIRVLLLVLLGIFLFAFLIYPKYLGKATTTESKNQSTSSNQDISENTLILGKIEKNTLVSDDTTKKNTIKNGYVKEIQINSNEKTYLKTNKETNQKKVTDQSLEIWDSKNNFLGYGIIKDIKDKDGVKTEITLKEDEKGLYIEPLQSGGASTLSANFYLINKFTNSIKWIDNDGDALEVEPSDMVRKISGNLLKVSSSENDEIRKYLFKEVQDFGEPSSKWNNDGDKLEDQLLCHYDSRVAAENKYWNIEAWRKDGSYLLTLKSKCNIGGGI